MNNDRAEWNPDRRLLIIDARSYTAAFANRAKGGGSECSGREKLLQYLVFNNYT